MSVLSHLSGAVQQSRQSQESDTSAGVLVLSAGDDCAGSIFDEIAFIQDAELPSHPCYKIYSRIGFDAVALGNHDFDLGLERLTHFIREYADYPVLAANLDCLPQYQDVIHPGAIILAGGVRIGIIGLVTRAESRLNPEQGRIVNPSFGPDWS